MKRSTLIVTFVLFCFTQFLHGQKPDCYDLFVKYYKYYTEGDFIKSRETLLKVLEPATEATPEYLYFACNNLGVLMWNLGEYDKALYYYSKAESYIRNPDSIDLANIYNNRGIILNIKKSYDVAKEYLEKSIRIFRISGLKDASDIKNLNAAYINISISLLETGNYSEAKSYLEKSIELGKKYNFPDLSLSYLNIAKVYNKLENSLLAGNYFLKSISQFRKDFGDGYYRMTDAYFDYGLFLQDAGRYDEAIKVYNKALKISMKNYGDKHTLVSLSYKHLADAYSMQARFDSAMYYYQKSLIAVTRNFDDLDIFLNPSIDSSIFELRLLDNLKSKAKTLGLISEIETDKSRKIKLLGMSLETNELAISLIDRIRSNILSEESRIYLAKNEKETYLSGVSSAFSLFLLNHDRLTALRMYNIAQKAKAAILRNEITENELLYSSIIPDSLRNEQNSLAIEIASYTNFIIKESRAIHPDTQKIAKWKDDLFIMNRKKENNASEIERVFPQFRELISKTEPVALSVIQDHLKKNEIIIDYLLSNNYTGGKRKLYIFCVSHNNLNIREELLDSSFVKMAGIIRDTQEKSFQPEKFTKYTGALNFMYAKLVQPIEEILTGDQLIVIPDEEIGWLPFDSFIKNKTGPEDFDFEKLHYLINDYTFSYSYSSSLIFNSPEIRRPNVFAFSPDYRNTQMPLLKGASQEIQSIFKSFGGKSFSGREATKENFIHSLNNKAVFHLAMHSMSDSLNSKYSYLIFDTQNNPSSDGKLYNYEISLSSVNSPMVVLSSCNSGSGTLYHGEGMMSLSRGFILAGASSVVKTAWNVNDAASSVIMTYFYDFLSEGRPKNEAMHLAKVQYLKTTPPAFKSPYFWAAYEVLGDFSPVAYSVKKILIIIFITLAFAATAAFYFKRRSIFSDRSR